MPVLWAQPASAGTLEEAEGVYVTADEANMPLTAPVSMGRFSALRTLWTRQVNSLTLQGITPGMPPSLKCGPCPCPLHEPQAAKHVLAARCLPVSGRTQVPCPWFVWHSIGAA